MKSKPVKKYKVDKTNTKQSKSYKMKVRQTSAKVPPGKQIIQEVVYISQAERIVAKFGGVPKLVVALMAVGLPKHYSCIYRWIYKGSIPNKAMTDVLIAAREEGIRLSSDDLSPIPSRRKIFHYKNKDKNRNVAKDGELIR